MKPLLIIDHQELTRLAMQVLADRSRLFSPIATAASKTELLSFLSRHDSAVVALDYSRLDLTADRLFVLADRFPTVHWILLCHSLSESLIRRIMVSQPHFSILFKDSSEADAAQSLRLSATGHRHLCAQALAIGSTARLEAASRPLPLTATETEILRAIAMGRSTKQIAADRFLSVYTVMTHRRNIFGKLGVSNVHEAMRYALRAGLVDTADYLI